MLSIRGSIYGCDDIHASATKFFSETMDKVCDDHAPIIITRQNERPVVMISLEDYNAIEETLYLLKSPKNAARLSKALMDIDKKKFLKKDLLDDNE